MASISGAAKIATMEFEISQNGQTRKAMVQLTARFTETPFTDVTVDVGTILAQAILEKTGYELTRAIIVEETTTQVYPPQQ